MKLIPILLILAVVGCASAPTEQPPAIREEVTPVRDTAPPRPVKKIDPLFPKSVLSVRFV